MNEISSIKGGPSEGDNLQRPTESPKKTRFIIIIVLIIIFIFIIGIYVAIFLRSSDILTNETGEEFTLEDTFSNGVDYCESISASPGKEYCMIDVAKYTGDETICENTGDYKDKCYAEVGIETKKVAICEKAGSKKNLCLSQIALETSNKQVCQLINTLVSKYEEDNVYNYSYTALSKNDCLAGVQKDESKCTTDICRFMVALRKNDQTFCNKYSDGNGDYCWFYTASFQQDYQLCDNLSFKYITEAVNGSTSYDACTQNGCLKEVAKKTLDEKICSLMDTPTEKEKNQKDYCYEQVAELKVDRSICKNVEMEGYSCAGALSSKCADTCIFNVAVEEIKRKQ